MAVRSCSSKTAMRIFWFARGEYLISITLYHRVKLLYGWVNPSDIQMSGLASEIRPHSSRQLILHSIKQLRAVYCKTSMAKTANQKC